MFCIGVGWEGQAGPGIEWEVISVFDFPPFGRGIEFIVINTGFLIAFEPHGHEFAIGAESDGRDGLAIVGPRVVRLGFLFLFGIINDSVVPCDVKKTVRR